MKYKSLSSLIMSTKMSSPGSETSGIDLMSEIVGLIKVVGDLSTRCDFDMIHDYLNNHVKKMEDLQTDCDYLERTQGMAVLYKLKSEEKLEMCLEECEKLKKELITSKTDYEQDEELLIFKNEILNGDGLVEVHVEYSDCSHSNPEIEKKLHCSNSKAAQLEKEFDALKFEKLMCDKEKLRLQNSESSETIEKLKNQVEAAEIMKMSSDNTISKLRDEKSRLDEELTRCNLEASRTVEKLKGENREVSEKVEELKIKLYTADLVKKESVKLMAKMGKEKIIDNQIGKQLKREKWEAMKKAEMLKEELLTADMEKNKLKGELMEMKKRELEADRVIKDLRRDTMEAYRSLLEVEHGGREKWNAGTCSSNKTLVNDVPIANISDDGMNFHGASGKKRTNPVPIKKRSNVVPTKKRIKF